MEKVVLIAYGNGAELGDFTIFTRTLKNMLAPMYNTIRQKHTDENHKLIDWILSVPPAAEKIHELHIFSHSIGAGLFLAYGDPVIGRRRDRLEQQQTVTYNQAIATEIGAVLTDDIEHSGKFMSRRAECRRRFSKDGFVQIWGCNSALAGWVYGGNKYWEALNQPHKPKPSVAQAVASFFNVSTWGASSGANIQVYSNAEWVFTNEYRAQHGRAPSGVLPHRLYPENGRGYHEFLPQGN